jgi:hypothetical protein
VQPPPPPEPAPSDDVEEELEIRTCFMGHEFGEIEAVPLFRYRALQRELAEAQCELAAFKGFEHRTLKALAEKRDDALGRLEVVRKARNQFERKLDEVTKQRDALVQASRIALKCMCRVTSPDHEFTSAVDALSAVTGPPETK